MPSGPLAHICLLVGDLDQAVAQWTEILGVLDPRQLEERLVRYDDFEGGADRMRWATFVNPDGAEIQLMQPDPDTPLGERLAKHGEGVHHICFTTDSPEDAKERLDAAGLKTGSVSADPNMPWQRWTWIMPGSANGTLVEVARPYVASDGRWKSADPQDP